MQRVFVLIFLFPQTKLSLFSRINVVYDDKTESKFIASRGG